MKKLHRTIPAFLIVAMIIAVLFSSPSPASAEPAFPVSYNTFVGPSISSVGMVAQDPSARAIPMSDCVFHCMQKLDECLNRPGGRDAGSRCGEENDWCMKDCASR